MSLLGNAVLVLAFLVAGYTILASLLDSRKNKYGFPTNARYGVFAVAGLLTLAEILLLISLLTHNFSLSYVTNFSSSDTPFIYLITGLWAGNSGALLFWAWIISLAAAVLLWRSNKANRDLMPQAVSVILFTELLFLILLFLESPFKGLSPVPSEGYGLNPLLQNPGMIFHPPLLLAGFALFTVIFALAISALYNRKADDVWVLTVKRWAVVAWILLGLGNVLGMWWAYGELGWGGYWAWDPVENAGLMPWLLLTAFLHSAAMYLRRGTFKGWLFTLPVAGFWLIIFGAFITRSDIQGSVHTFGQTPMTPAFIVFLAVNLSDRCGCLSAAAGF
jgi:cytochrome c-type biogenesis protein CcmF